MTEVSLALRVWFWKRRHDHWMVQEAVAGEMRRHARSKLRNLAVEAHAREENLS